MNRILDIAIATEICVVVAATSTYLAHLIASGVILNDNWMFAMYLLIGVATLFMALPFAFAAHTTDAHGRQLKFHLSVERSLRAQLRAEKLAYAKLHESKHQVITLTPRNDCKSCSARNAESAALENDDPFHEQPFS